MVLRDEQPRGTGRVVNFLKDLKLTTEGRGTPHFAKKVSEGSSSWASRLAEDADGDDDE